jgi:hypothetical protein
MDEWRWVNIDCTKVQIEPGGDVPPGDTYRHMSRRRTAKTIMKILKEQFPEGPHFAKRAQDAYGKWLGTPRMPFTKPPTSPEVERWQRFEDASGEIRHADWQRRLVHAIAYIDFRNLDPEYRRLNREIGRDRGR